MRNRFKIIFAFFFMLSICILNRNCPSTLAKSTSNLTNSTDKGEKNNSLSDYSSRNEFLKTFYEDKCIKNYEYLYNLDDSCDYVCIEFENSGYAIYSKETMELLEYNPYDNLPYTESNSLKYYAGPYNFFYKNEKDQFFDLLNGNKVEVLETKIKKIAQNIRNSIINNNTSIYDEDIESLIAQNDFENLYLDYPNIDSSNLIKGDTSSGNLIANYDYFTSTPTIGNNYSNGSYGNGNSGTCGPIAAQLLLGYNNFYNDRRIIEDRYLNGYDDTSKSVVDIEKNPNYCTDPMSMTSFTTGTRSEDSGLNSFYSEIISRIMKPNTKGSTIKEVKNGIEDYLNDYLSTNEFSINYAQKTWWFGYKPIESTYIKSELNAGRPIILSMSSNIGGSDHFVVGYGYDNHTYADGLGTYDGYIVHYGWKGNDKTCVWINSSWCDGYISLKINHIHNYITKGKINNTIRMEYKCSICGHRSDAAINMTNREQYIERFSTLSAGKYKDYYVTFNTSGIRLIQTFGTKDTQMCLYDNEYNLLAEDDDSGYTLNSFLNYNFSTNIFYILRVNFFSKSQQGNIKIGITPPSIEYNTYDKILSSKSQNVTYGFQTIINCTNIFTFTPTLSGKYEFITNYTSNNRIDTCLFVVDPSSTNECLYNDDGGLDLQALITMNLIEGRSYFCSSFNL